MGLRFKCESDPPGTGQLAGLESVYTHTHGRSAQGNADRNFLRIGIWHGRDSELPIFFMCADVNSMYRLNRVTRNSNSRLNKIFSN